MIQKVLTGVLCILYIGLNAQTSRNNPEKITARWLTGQSLHLAYSLPDSMGFAAERKPGKNWFFEFSHQSEENPEVSDDEMTETIGFEVVPNRTGRFELKNEQLTGAKAYYMLGCFCKERGYSRIEHGTIKGVRLSMNQWLINVDVQLKVGESERKKRFRRTFIRSKD